MKHKLSCRLFGHNFRRIIESDFSGYTTVLCDYCTKCGLSKEECEITEARKR